MKYLNTVLTFLGLVLGFFDAGLKAQENIFLPMNASRIRALGMGAAFQATRDDLGAVSYNPANYSLYDEAKNFRFTIFLSPALPILVATRSEEFFAREAERKETAYAAIVSSIKGINLTYKNMDLGIILGEPLLVDSLLVAAKQTPFHVKSLYTNHYNAVALRIRLAEQVAFGASLFLSYFSTNDESRNSSLAASYGITLQPNHYISVGVSLFSAPSKFSRFREFLDEVYNDAINLGITLNGPWQLDFAFDIRNLAVSQETEGERYLAGIEKSFWGQIAIRAGIQYRPDEKSFTYTTGLSLLNLNAIWNGGLRFKHQNFALNYVFIRKKIFQEDFNIHGVNVLFRL